MDVKALLGKNRASVCKLVDMNGHIIEFALNGFRRPLSRNEKEPKSWVQLYPKSALFLRFLGAPYGVFCPKIAFQYPQGESNNLAHWAEKMGVTLDALHRALHRLENASSSTFALVLAQLRAGL